MKRFNMIGSNITALVLRMTASIATNDTRKPISSEDGHAPLLIERTCSNGTIFTGNTALPVMVIYAFWIMLFDALTTVARSASRKSFVAFPTTRQAAFPSRMLFPETSRLKFTGIGNTALTQNLLARTFRLFSFKYWICPSGALSARTTTTAPYFYTVRSFLEFKVAVLTFYENIRISITHLLHCTI